MKNHDTIAIRLAQILNKLNSGERFGINDLVDEFGVTKRTIQRDLNERLSYLPIKKENELFYLEEYYLGKLNFEDIKNFATLSGIKELYPSLQEGFLKEMLDHTVNQAYLIKGHNYEDISKKTTDFKLVQNAILNNQQVAFVYKEKQRVVNPYKLLNSKGIWYLAGLDKELLKTFAFKKIENLNVLEQTFKIDREVLDKIKDEDDISFSSKQIEVVLQIDKNVADYFQRRNILPNQTIVKELTEGGLLVSTKVAYEEEVLKLVRYWIPNVKIISPIKLQNKLEKVLFDYIN